VKRIDEADAVSVLALKNPGKSPPMIDVQVGEQDGIHLLEIDFQFSHAEEGPGACIHQDSWRSVQLDDVA